MSFTLWQRLSTLFAVLLLGWSALFAWFHIRASAQDESEVMQRLSRGLAEHVASHNRLLSANGFDLAAAEDLLHMLMAVNPSVEIYLIDNQGAIVASLAPAGHVKRQRVDLAPIRRFVEGDALPIFGDDPRSPDGRKVFSAAALMRDGRAAGYVYVVLLGESRDALSSDIGRDTAMRTTLWSIAAMGLLALLAGLVAFGFVTRPLRRLTEQVRRLERDGVDAVDPAAWSAPSRPGGRDEIALLQHSFGRMAGRVATQWRELVRQDHERRELVANISHDLRTPLTSLHGYLETLAHKSDQLTPEERRRYLDTALGQSRKVGRLATELFELARLEHGVVKPEIERFSLPELVQDVFQKFELAAQSRELSLQPDFAMDLPPVNADLGMIERVLTNLIDNAIRHTPQGGQVRVQLRGIDDQVTVRISDTGPGVSPERRSDLFHRRSALAASERERSGGLGLVIVQRILRLHNSDIRLQDAAGEGAVFSFGLAAA